MSHDKALQDSFLSQLKKEETLVSIFLISGIKLHGTIYAYDEEVIMLKSAITQIVYKHAISTVVPTRSL